jgi:hypothetical protein
MKEIKYLGILAIALSFMQCGSVSFDKTPPFNITEATYTNWIGGQPGVSGTKVFITYSLIASVDFDSIYFKNSASKIELHSKGAKMILIGNFSTSNRAEHDLVLHIDSKKERNNKPPETTKIPFELKENEAVISYKEKGKPRYFKIANLKKEATNFYQ